MQWEVKKPLFAYALKRGRRINRHKAKEATKNENKGSVIEGYIWDTLTEDEKKVWRKLKRFDRARTGKEVINAILEKRGKIFRQHLFIHAMVHSNYQVTRACRMCGIDIQTFDRWRAGDADFNRLFLAIKDAQQDRLMNAYWKLIDVRNEQAVIHGVKTLCKDKGFGEKTEVDVKVSGEIQHNLIQIDVDALPLDMQTRLLEEVRKVKQVESQTVNTAVPMLPSQSLVPVSSNL